jgi:L-lactate dehydrogenase
LTVSSHHNEFAGVRDICLSLPTVINREGVFHVIKPKLSEEEQIDLKDSADKMKTFTQKALELIV